MIQATPFELKLFTGATNEPIQDREIHYGEVYTLFDQLRGWFLDTNRRLTENPALAAHDLGLRVPLTEILLWQLLDTPPWSEASQSSNLYTLKAEVISFLHRSDCLLELDDTELEEHHRYQLHDAPNFLPRFLAPELCENWVKAVGACGFERRVAEPRICLEPIHAVWVVSDGEHNQNELKIRRIGKDEGSPEECTLPLLPQVDEWAWERLVREALWQDERLPFNGPHPDGPFGYCPTGTWNPGNRPKSVRIRGASGYKDALGGLWQWEGGRARMATPYDGHWNVQLLNARAKQNWRRWLALVYSSSSVRLLSNHINVEADGRIVDRTFDLGK